MEENKHKPKIKIKIKGQIMTFDDYGGQRS